MSATLTWYNSGLVTKTGTAIGNYFTDMKTLFDSKAADSNFKWEVAASSLAGTPYYLWLRRKDASNGRILLVAWSSSPAGNNAAILQGAPATNTVFVAWFPNGNAASPSNLTASSGTISGDDTNCVLCSNMGLISTIYAASTQGYYFDCEEGLAFGSNNPASSTAYLAVAGDLVVDANDVAYGMTLGLNGTSSTGLGSTTAGLPFISSGAAAGTANPAIKSNYASQAAGAGPVYPTWYQAYTPTAWAGVSIGANDILTDTSNSDAWFVAIPLVSSNVKGGGFPLKLRQIAIGPQSVGAFSVYNVTGPVVAARCWTPTTASSVGHPWFTNFKI